MINRNVEIFGKPLNRPKCLGEGGATLECQGRYFLIQREELVERPTDPKVLLQDL